MAIARVATERAQGPGARGSALAALVRGLGLFVLAALCLGSVPAPAADKVRVTGLADLSFGSVANLGVDAVRAEDVCLFSNSSTNGYNVTATGTGPSGEFELSSGTDVLPFDVAWNSAPGQSSGTLVTANLPLTGQLSTATQQTCNSGPAVSASLIVILRSAALSSATAGTYNGTLTLVVAPE